MPTSNKVDFNKLDFNKLDFNKLKEGPSTVLATSNELANLLRRIELLEQVKQNPDYVVKLNFVETEIQDIGDMMDEIWRLKAILQAIFSAYCGMEIAAISETIYKELMDFIGKKQEFLGAEAMKQGGVFVDEDTQEKVNIVNKIKQSMSYAKAETLIEKLEKLRETLPDQASDNDKRPQTPLEQMREMLREAEQMDRIP